jgi:hypothetical protein
MFPVFPVLFPVSSQLKPMKRITVPTVPSCSVSDYFANAIGPTSKVLNEVGTPGTVGTTHYINQLPCSQ